MLFASFTALSLLPAALAAPLSRRNYSNATVVETCSLALNQSVTSQIRHSIDTRSAWVPQQNDDGEYTTVEVVRSFSFCFSTLDSGNDADLSCQQTTLGTMDPNPTPFTIFPTDNGKHKIQCVAFSSLPPLYLLTSS
jgi:hypothetical protein